MGVAVVVVVVGVPLWAAAVGIVVVKWGGGGCKWARCRCHANLREAPSDATLLNTSVTSLIG